MMTVNEFLADTVAGGGSGERFQCESANVLRVDINGGVWIKPGAAVAYRGSIRFDRHATLHARSVGDAVLRELMPLVRASGHGRLYCAHRGWEIHVIRLAGETVHVAWQELLAFEESVRFEEVLIGDGLSALGGLRIVRLSGDGAVALVIHGRPLTLPVSPGNPVRTDPHATLAWAGSLKLSLKTDLGWRSAIGHGGQEPFQIQFEGSGHVIVQPHEHPETLQSDARKMVRQLLA